MTVRLIADVEEAISREVRRISFHSPRTVDRTVLKEVFDVLTGEIVQMPIEASFYDSSADATSIDYPHFFVRLLKTREDRFSGRVVPQYGKYVSKPILTSPRAYEIILYQGDGSIPIAGNDLKTGTFRISKVQVGNLLRILSGPNIGTYKVSAVIKDPMGNHTITVSNDLLTSLPTLSFNSNSRVVSFTSPVDLSTVKVGDNFIDSTLTSFPITAIDAPHSQITLGSTGSPSTLINSKINRPGNVFAVDGSLITYSVMDASKPVTAPSLCTNTTNNELYDPQVPLDLFYLVRIDSKERDDHIAIANRIWEEFFNPPRTALSVLVRSKLSAEQALAVDVTTGGSTTIDVGDNTNYNVGETVFVIDDFNPTKSSKGRFDEPFSAKVVDKISSNQLVLDKTVPDTFKTQNNTKVVSNAEFHLYMFHFVDHVTRDVEGSQYWVHEFQAIVQVWIDRQGDPDEFSGVIQKISTPIEDLESNVLASDL
jgi:hypothetical protein